VKKSILPWISQQLTRLAVNRTAVLTDALRGIEFNRQQKRYQFSTKTPDTADCLIVGKEHYSEQNRAFPIQSRRALTKILALESANSDGVMLYAIGRYDDGQRNVVCWKIKPQTIAALGFKPQFILPESVLLLFGQSNQLFTVTRDKSTYWYIEREGQFRCAQKKGLIANAQMFLASAGLSAQTDTVDVGDDNYADLLMTPFSSVLMGNFGGFNAGLRSLKEVDWKQHLKFSGISATLLIVAYFSLTSLYLSKKYQSVKETSVVLTKQTKEVFEIKKLLGRAESKSSQLAQVTEQVTAPNVMWRFVSPLVLRGIVITRIGLSPDGVFSITADADKATEVLEFIKSDPVVVEPQFRGQTSIIKKKERFSVAFKIQEGI
jgi:hypothetical protein